MTVQDDSILGNVPSFMITFKRSERWFLIPVCYPSAYLMQLPCNELCLNITSSAQPSQTIFFLRFLPQLEMRPTSIAPNPKESREASPKSTVSLTSQSHSAHSRSNPKPFQSVQLVKLVLRLLVDNIEFQFSWSISKPGPSSQRIICEMKAPKSW